MQNSTRWSELSSSTRKIIVVVGVVELVLQVIANRDLHRRSSAELRGPKALWRLILLIQPVGPIAYLAAARK